MRDIEIQQNRHTYVISSLKKVLEKFSGENERFLINDARKLEYSFFKNAKNKLQLLRHIIHKSSFEMDHWLNVKARYIKLQEYVSIML